MIIRRLTVLGLLFSIHLAFASSDTPAKHKTVYDYSLVALDGKEISLSTYKGKVLLIVNLASKSIYKNQIAALEDLQKTYADKGLVLVGIPSADFGAQELSDNSAIQHYYQDTEHINFPVFSKASLRGKRQHSFKRAFSPTLKMELAAARYIGTSPSSWLIGRANPFCASR